MNPDVSPNYPSFLWGLWGKYSHKDKEKTVKNTYLSADNLDPNLK